MLQMDLTFVIMWKTEILKISLKKGSSPPQFKLSNLIWSSNINAVAA